MCDVSQSVATQSRKTLVGEPIVSGRLSDHNQKSNTFKRQVVQFQHTLYKNGCSVNSASDQALDQMTTINRGSEFYAGIGSTVGSIGHRGTATTGDRRFTGRRGKARKIESQAEALGLSRTIGRTARCAGSQPDGWLDALTRQA